VNIWKGKFATEAVYYYTLCLGSINCQKSRWKVRN